jgi:hypothetical protein
VIPSLPTFIRAQLRFPPPCPAQSVATRSAGQLPVRSPTPPFGCAGSLLAGPPASVICPGLTCNGGLSLARNDCPFPGHRYEVKAPGLPLPRHTRAFPGAVWLTTPPPVPVCTRHGRDHSGQPALPLQLPRLQPRLGFLLPFRVFVPSGSTRTTRLAAEKPTFRRRPIALRSPQPPYIIVMVADHRSGLATALLHASEVHTARSRADRHNRSDPGCLPRNPKRCLFFFADVSFLNRTLSPKGTSGTPYTISSNAGRLPTLCRPTQLVVVRRPAWH